MHTHGVKDLVDPFGRVVRDLRISVTDRCNFRCTYCMPKELFGKDHVFLPRDQLLSFDEIDLLVGLFVDRGVRKVRITGGEPLLRKDLEKLIGMLKKAYWMEIETVMSYITNSVNPDGVRAQEIVESLEEDIQEELGHAQQFATRIKELWGIVPGSLEFEAEQDFLQPPDHQTDIVHVIKGVIGMQVFETTEDLAKLNRAYWEAIGCEGEDVERTDDRLVAIIKTCPYFDNMVDMYGKEAASEMMKKTIGPTSATTRNCCSRKLFAMRA